MGSEAEKIYTSFQLATTVPAPAAGAAAAATAATAVPNADNFDLVMKRFDAYFIPKGNVIHERAKFHLRVQQAGKNAESFYRSQMELSETCDFKEKNEEIRDRLVIGILDKELSLELQSKADLTLENCIDMVRNSEMVKKQNEVVKGVDHVSRRGRRGRFHKRVTSEVQTLTYFLTITTHNVLPKMKSITDPILCWDLMESNIRKVIDQMCPIKNFKVPSSKDPWITNELLEDIRDKDLALKKARRTARRERNRVGKLIASARRTFFEEEEYNSRGDPKRFWKNISTAVPNSKSKLT